MREMSVSSVAGSVDRVWWEEQRDRIWEAGVKMTGRPVSTIVHSIWIIKPMSFEIL